MNDRLKKKLERMSVGVNPSPVLAAVGKAETRSDWDLLREDWVSRRWIGGGGPQVAPHLAFEHRYTKKFGGGPEADDVAPFVDQILGSRRQGKTQAQREILEHYLRTGKKPIIISSRNARRDAMREVERAFQPVDIFDDDDARAWFEGRSGFECRKQTGLSRYPAPPPENKPDVPQLTLEEWLALPNGKNPDYPKNERD